MEVMLWGAMIWEGKALEGDWALVVMILEGMALVVVLEGGCFVAVMIWEGGLEVDFLVVRIWEGMALEGGLVVMILEGGLEVGCSLVDKLSEVIVVVE